MTRGLPTIATSSCQDNSVRDASPVGPFLGTTYHRTRTLLYIGLFDPFPYVPLPFFHSRTPGSPSFQAGSSGLLIFVTTEVYAHVLPTISSFPVSNLHPRAPHRILCPCCPSFIWVLVCPSWPGEVEGGYPGPGTRAQPWRWPSPPSSTFVRGSLTLVLSLSRHTS